MNDLEPIARKLARKITDELPPGVVYVLILADNADIGSASNMPRDRALLVTEAYQERIRALAAMGTA